MKTYYPQEKKQGQSELCCIKVESEMAQDTLPVITIYEGWNDIWFWIVHVASVILIVVLIIVTCVLCMERKSHKKEYESVQ
ncbi:hypothetical protein Tcan_13821 [Toxocara canis]|uniref:Transmembrane protein n=1 Tax=Toxocara canis TaxID=6265 RepID=A0A0B2VQV6_TOXCA|nr:hypothetical protein Tcan_13821 [Toxocara canis]